MDRFRALLLLWFALAGAGSAAPKVALVRVADIYRQLETTAVLNEEIRAEQAAVDQDPRRRAMDEALAERDVLYKQLLKATEDGADPAARERMERAYVMKTQEAITLQREFASFRERRMKEINTRLVARMEESLERIRAAAAALGAEKGFDWVLDASGNTNSQLPFVLYAKNPTDLTGDVVAALAPQAVETAGTTEE